MKGRSSAQRSTGIKMWKILVITSRVSVRHSHGQRSGQRDYALKAALSSRKAAWRSLRASSSCFRSSCSAFNSASNLLEHDKAWACREIANRRHDEGREGYGGAGTPNPCSGHAKLVPRVLALLRIPLPLVHNLPLSRLPVAGFYLLLFRGLFFLDSFFRVLMCTH